MWTISDHKDWEALSRKFAWVADMSGVPQDPVHHAEGDVATHTQMVLEALTSLPQYAGLSHQDRGTLWAAALLHDVEKRSTTITLPDGSIASPGHARRGMYTARSVLYREMLAPFAIREQVAKLVRYHGLPIWLFEKPDPQRAAVLASLEVNTDWLALLAQADMTGRICQDQADMLYRVDCFREYCAEQRCLGQPYGFDTDTARFRYSTRPDSALLYVPYEEPQFTVVLMSGLPGAGKDTFVRRHYADWPVISLDAMRTGRGVSHGDKTGSGQVIQAAREKAREYLRRRQSFVWNATNITQQLRSQLISLCSEYGARICIEYVEVPYRTLLRQNASREAAIPQLALERLIDKLEVPVLSEAHEVNYHVS